MHFLWMSNCNRKSKWSLITRTRLIILFLGEQKQNWLNTVVSKNASGTNDLKQLVQLKPIFSLKLFIIWVENFTLNQIYRRAPMPKCHFNKVAKHLDDCFSIRHIKHLIPLLFTQVSISHLPKSYRKIKFSFYFHTVYTGVFSSCSYRSSYSGRFFSTAILLSYRFLSSRRAYQNIY